MKSPGQRQAFNKGLCSKVRSPMAWFVPDSIPSPVCHPCFIPSCLYAHALHQKQQALLEKGEGFVSNLVAHRASSLSSRQKLFVPRSQAWGLGFLGSEPIIMASSNHDSPWDWGTNPKKTKWLRAREKWFVQGNVGFRLEQEMNALWPTILQMGQVQTFLRSLHPKLQTQWHLFSVTFLPFGTYEM
jgi:hypothetical protein